MMVDEFTRIYKHNLVGLLEVMMYSAIQLVSG